MQSSISIQDLKRPRVSAQAVQHVLSLTIAAQLALLLAFTAFTLFKPILDSYSQRQAQTAISVFWMLHDGVFIDYLTPVLGFPWALPIEAPVYQIPVAVAAYVTHADLDAVGRIVSLLFFLGALWCGYRIVRLLTRPDSVAPKLFLVFALASPALVFWSRTFMIETTAMFFAAAWLLCLLTGTEKRSIGLLILSVPLCALAALAKVTTWPAFVGAFGLYFLARLYRDRSYPIIPLLFAAGGILIAYVSSSAWTVHSDLVKLANPYGYLLEYKHLQGWIYGNLEQRLSKNLWLNLVPFRMLPDMIGYCWPVLLLCVPFLRPKSPRTLMGLCCFVLFFVPILLFTNLHIAHTYYQLAGAGFIVGCAAFFVAEVANAGRPGLAAALVVLLVAGSAVRFFENQWPQATGPLENAATYQAGKAVERSTPPDSALIVLGMDWDPEIHYYAQRKGFALPMWWTTPERTKEILDNPDAIMGGLHVRAVVDCGTIYYGTIPPDRAAILTDFVKKWSEHSTVAIPPAPGRCAVYIDNHG